jgi:hemolysin activation/secretion protein
MSLYIPSMRELPEFSYRSGSKRTLRHPLNLGLLILGLLFTGSSHAVEEADCIEFKALDVKANALLDSAAAFALVSSLEGRCIDAQLIRDILSRVSSYFIEQGYVTTRPYLLEQDISDGEIDIEVLIGFIEAIVDADSGTGNASIASAFAFNNRVLNLRELETSLEAIERPQSVQATMEIRPGTQQGSSIIAIKTVKSRPFHLELGANARTDVDPQLSLRATLDNPLNINDILEFRYNSGDQFQAYQSDRSRELDYSVVFGSYQLLLSHSDITYKQRLQGLSGSLLAEGESISDQLRLGKLLGRGQNYRLNLGIGIELKDSRNLFEGEVIDVSSYRTSKAVIELRHDLYASWGQLLTRYAYQQGLNSFGAREDGSFTVEDGIDDEARLQFKKHILEGQLHYYLMNPAWSLQLKFHGQYSNDLLFSADKLFLGSENTVRGYTSALSGSNGWYARSDLVKRLQSVINPFSGSPLSKLITLSLGIDYGEIRCEVDNPDLCGDIYSLGAGIGIMDDNFSGLLSWGHPLKELEADIGREDVFLLDFRWGL